jgi:hypothetical protein
MVPLRTRGEVGQQHGEQAEDDHRDALGQQQLPMCPHRGREVVP